MNEDIKILREALAELNKAMQMPKPKGDLGYSMEVMRYRRDAVVRFNEFCTPQIIGRILDDAERALDLELALRDARFGFHLAYEAAEKGFNDEVLLHCGHHGAKADKALGVEE